MYKYIFILQLHVNLKKKRFEMNLHFSMYYVYILFDSVLKLKQIDII